MYPTQLLTQEHRTIELLLDRLVEAAFAAARNDAPDVALLQRLVRALSVLLGRWHKQKEEELFFPLIQKRGITEHVMRAALVQEVHDTLEGDVELLRSVVDRCSDDPRLLPKVSFRAVDLATRVRGHMSREEEIIFPLAEASLLESDREALLLAFAQVERLDPFPGVREDIERLVGGRRVGAAVVTGITEGAARSSTWNRRDPVRLRACI